MTKPEFAQIIAYLSHATGKQIADTKEEAKARTEVYFDLLGDLAIDTLQTAAKRVALSHPWPSFPSAAEIREAASLTMRGIVAGVSPAEAWDKAWRATKRIDPDVEGSIQRACDHLPPLVVEAMQAFGILALVYSQEPIGVMRGQFMKIYEQLLRRMEQHSLLPASVKKEIVRIGKRDALPGAAAQAIKQIGVEK